MARAARPLKADGRPEVLGQWMRADIQPDSANIIIDNHPIGLLFSTIIGFVDDELISLGLM